MEQDNSSEQKKKSEILKRQISILRSGNTKAITDILDEIREDGDISILPEIFELMLVGADDSVNKKCTTLLCDIKATDAKIFFIDAIKDVKFKPILNQLVSACWQNGLQYADEVLLFADILLKEEYIVSIEAFTVIENSIGDMDDKKRAELIVSLETGLKVSDKEKEPLIKELIRVIKAY